ncbi:MAG: GNAT family N-acetyltransferase [Arachnia propionica]|nr:MAG: GNAT family N-acetyltransferase [Arachnia propionica]
MPDAFSQIFPPLGLRIEAGPLELRGIGPEEFLALLDVARAGIHPPEDMPFGFPWTETPPEHFALQYLQWWASLAANWSQANWDLELAVLWQGQVVGVQGVRAKDFLTLRHGETGSWLGMPHQGKGIGTAMRQALCAFLFDYLDFSVISSQSFTDNAASLAVSRKVGFRDNGVSWLVRRGIAETMRNLSLRPEDLVRGPELSVTGAEAMRALVGLD